MKVAIIYGGSKTGGGVDTYLTNFFEYAPKDVELELLSLGDWKLAQVLRSKEQEVRVFGGKWWNAVNIFKIASYLRENRFDLIVSQGMVANFYARVASLISGVPSLVTIHSDWRTDYRGIKKIIYLVFDRFFRFRTKRYIAVSEYLQKQLVSEGVDPDKVTVIYNGVALGDPIGVREKKQGVNENVVASKTHNPYSTSQTSGKLAIGSVGRLHPVKNFDQLILATGILKDKGVNVRLEVAGEGVERRKLEKVIRQNGLSNNVRLLGWQKDLEKLFADWDLYVQPSITEGFGLAVVEAMLVGLPVVVTPGGALPELVRDGQTGTVARGFGHQDLAEAIEKMIADPEKMKKMAENGQKYAKENFDIDKWVKKTFEVYREVAK